MAVGGALADAGLDPQERNLGGAAPLQRAIRRRGYRGFVRLLLEKEVDTEITWNGGAAALYRAAKLGRLKVVQKLVAREADVFVRAASFETPFDAASRRNRNAVAEYFPTCLG